MFYTIICVITIIAFILLIVALYYNKFQFTIIKIEEAESNTEIYLNKKVELLNRLIPIVKSKIKDKKLLNKIDVDELNHFELNKKLSHEANNIYTILDDEEKLLKIDKIVNLIEEINDNEEDLIASIKYYNDTVVDFNKLILSFPSNIIRLFFGYKKKEFYSNEKREMFEILREEKKED